MFILPKFQLNDILRQTNKQINNVEKKERNYHENLTWLQEYPNPSTDLKFAPFNFVDLIIIVRSEVFMAMTTKNAFFWDVAQCRSCMNRHFGGTYRLHLQGRKIHERGTSVGRWLQSSLAYFSTLKMEAIRSSETSIHTRSSQHHIPENCILHWPLLLGILYFRVAMCVNHSSLANVAENNSRVESEWKYFTWW
jgi:hypothetical protein